jgi:hypothetical protein
MVSLLNFLLISFLDFERFDKFDGNEVSNEFYIELNCYCYYC